MLTILVVGIAGYAMIGVLFSVWFVLRGAGALDPVAGAAPLRVRTLFAFGAVALWPALIRSSPSLPPDAPVADDQTTNSGSRP